MSGPASRRWGRCPSGFGRLSGSFVLPLPLNDLYVQSRRIAHVSPPVTYGLLVLGWFLLLGFALSVAALGGVAPGVRAFQVAYVVGFIGYSVLIGVLVRSRERTKIGRWRWWFAGCVVLRLLLAATEPTNDAFRYVWEGRVQRAGCQ